MNRIVALAAIAALGPAAAAQLQVWTVDDDGPADFGSLQAAIDHAQEGDALLVRGGTYLPAVIDAKRLTILADEGELVTIPQQIFAFDSRLTISGTSVGQPVTIVGLDLSVGASTDHGFALDASGLQGALWIQDCFLEARGGVRVTDSYLVARDSVLRGTFSADIIVATLEGHAVESRNSLLRVYGCTLQGSAGPAAGCTFGFGCGTKLTGGDGLHLLTGSAAHLSGVIAQGGHGLESLCEPLAHGWAGSGGDGIHLEQGSQALAIDSQFFAGDAGKDFTICGDGDPGMAVKGLGSLTTSPYVRRSLSVDGIVREGESVVVTILAPANESAFVGIATTPGELQDPLIDGPLILGSAPGVLPLGPMPATGRMHFVFPAPELPPGVDFFTLYLQPAFAVAPGVGVAGDPMALVILDSAF